jgi:hypothetical protein
MHDLRMKPPPLAKRPSGVLLPPTNRSRIVNLSSTNGSAVKEGLEVCLIKYGLANYSYVCFIVGGAAFQSATVS